LVVFTPGFLQGILDHYHSGPEPENPMRTPFVLIIIAGWFARSVAAQLTTNYSGIQSDHGKEVPASAQFAVQDGRIAMIMKGSHSARMLFDAKGHVLHIVSDDDKKYFDIEKKSGGPGDQSGMMATMQAQLAKMPAEQRAMAEQMMKSAMGKAPPPLVYVRTGDKQKISGYECTRVEGKRGEDKVTEYCGTTSADFTLSGPERETILDLQGYLRNFPIMVESADEATRAFQWDLATDGYPVLTRCFRNGQITLDLKLDSLSRAPLPNSLFDIPSGYQKMDFSMGRPPRQ
jgi:hypothetical protein